MSDTPTELDLLFREGETAPPNQTHDTGEEDAPKRRRRRRHGGGEKSSHELNLTAMMDMMTIILVFLLKNYASTPENISVSDDLGPPRSSTKIPMDVAVTITVTKKGILVDDKPVAAMKDGSVVGETGGSTNAPIAALNEVLDRKVADMNAIAAKGGSPFEGKILIVADEKTSYAMLMRVLYTAGIAQFSQYKLVVRSLTAQG